MIRYLARADIERLGLKASELADAIEQALLAMWAGELTSLPKSSAALKDGRLFQAIMAIGGEGAAPAFAATKVVGLSARNVERDLPHIGSVIVLLDGHSGQPVALMDGTWITAHRTAALTLVAARRWARPDAASIGFVGCGIQARAHLAALRDAFPIGIVRAFARTPASAEKFADEAAGLGLDAQAVPKPDEAIGHMDLVVTSVPAAADLSPFLEPRWLSPGSFAALADLGRSWIDQGFDAIDRIIVDDLQHTEPARHNRRLTPSKGEACDLAQLISNKASGRTNARQRAVFVFQGIAAADLAAATLVYLRAEKSGAGQMLVP